MSEWDISVQEKGVISVFKGNDFIGAIESTTAAHKILTDLVDQLTHLKRFAREASRVAEFYGDKESWDISGAIEGLQTTIIQNDVDIVRLGENESLECGGKTARNFLNSDIYKQVMEGME